MARKHLAPTAVSIAPLAEKSPFERTLEKYWIHVLVGLGLVSALILVRHYRGSEARKGRDISWDKLLVATDTPPFPKIPVAEPTVLAGLAGELNGTAAGPWAYLIWAENALGRKDYAAAREALERLRTTYPTHHLVKETVVAEGSPATGSVVDRMLASIDRLKAWDEELERKSLNPAPPDTASRVRLKTDRGDIVIALYAEQAPKHVENFLKLAREGFYNGTKFHRVVPGFMIQGGDPNSREGDVATWGQGGPGYKVDRETNSLLHEAGVLSAAKQGSDVESSGSQFFITTDAAHHLDGKHVVFGKVVEGLDIAKQIGSSPTVAGTERPETPVTLVSVEVL